MLHVRPSIFFPVKRRAPRHEKSALFGALLTGAVPPKDYVDALRFMAVKRRNGGLDIHNPALFANFKACTSGN